MKRVRVRNLGLLPGRWFALMRKPSGLPVLFADREQATEGLDVDEYMVEVYVHAASTRDVLKGQQWKLRQQEKAKQATKSKKAKVRRKLRAVPLRRKRKAR